MRIMEYTYNEAISISRPHARLSTLPRFFIFTIREKLICEMAIKDDALACKKTKRQDTCRPLVHEHVISRCIGLKQAIC
jgi:hypothetical protein